MARPVYLTAEEHARVSAAVARAEENTSGEIVTIIAERSDNYTDVALAWAAAASLIALCALAIAPDFYLALYERLTGGWIHRWTPRDVFALAAGVAVLKFAGMMLVQLWPPLKFLLIPPPIKTARVHERAIRSFRIGAERRTHGRTGILIYLSMREHRAEIVADEAIAGKVGQEVWGDAMVAMLAELKQSRTAEGMIAAVEQVSAVLAEHNPREAGDINELPDRLIEL
jgi:putative membrane protein